MNEPLELARQVPALTCPQCDGDTFTFWVDAPSEVCLQSRRVHPSPCEEQTTIFCKACNQEITPENELWDAVCAIAREETG